LEETDMRYIKVAWDHHHANEPIMLYSECDDRGWEIRKVEIFRDGRFGYASGSASAEGTRLGIEPIPTFEEIAKQAEFRPSEITPQEFEEVWSAAQTGPLENLRNRGQTTFSLASLPDLVPDGTSSQTDSASACLATPAS
jgi:hypothetical protein